MTVINKHNLKILLFSLLTWFFLFYNTIASMVTIWWTSDTFAHGLLIFPISFYLIWQKRYLFIEIKTQRNAYFLLLLLGLSLLWMLAAIVDVQVIKQLSIVLMLPALLGALFGAKILKAYAFPLCYLIFAVPFGEFLIPKLQHITALITIWGLELTGIPVFSEGLYISIPSGDFEVAVACSGIRYLIASLALGTLYAYLTYQKLYKRLIFIVVSFIVPIIANGIRAYGIVMIAHLSDMKYATGVDHLIYGWLFFGVVIFLLFYIGSFWRDTDIEKVDIENTENIVSTEVFNREKKDKTSIPTYTFLFIILIMLSGPIINYVLNHLPQQAIRTFNLSDEKIDKWSLSPLQKTNWSPQFKGSDVQIMRNYTSSNSSSNGEIISNYLAYYQSQTQNKELINHGNSAYAPENNKLIAKYQKQIMINNQKINLTLYKVINNQHSRIIISWYYVFDQAMTNPIKIKILQAIGKISALAKEGYYIAYSIDYSQDDKQAEKELLSFIDNHWPLMRLDLE